MLRQERVCFREHVKGASDIQRLHTVEYNNADFHAVTLIDCKHATVGTTSRRPVGGLPADSRYKFAFDARKSISEARPDKASALKVTCYMEDGYATREAGQRPAHV
jgi:hypothetical protein